MQEAIALAVWEKGLDKLNSPPLNLPASWSPPIPPNLGHHHLVSLSPISNKVTHSSSSEQNHLLFFMPKEWRRGLGGPEWREGSRLHLRVPRISRGSCMFSTVFICERVSVMCGLWAVAFLPCASGWFRGWEEISSVRSLSDSSEQINDGACPLAGVSIYVSALLNAFHSYICIFSFI